MSDKYELKFAYAIAVVCLIVGVICYGAVSAEAPETPVRVMFQATGEDVLFGHKVHEDYTDQCTDCHHAIAQQKDGKAASCGSCHTRETEYVPALGEKGMFDHQVHSENYGLSCTDCHHEMEDMGIDPQSCGACHTPGAEGVPGMAEVAHKQCIECHGNMGSGPVTDDCGACHKPRPRTDAFHTQCIECHEKAGSGPTNDDCKKCHGY